jgi:hypothetical protein
VQLLGSGAQVPMSVCADQAFGDGVTIAMAMDSETIIFAGVTMMRTPSIG